MGVSVVFFGYKVELWGVVLFLVTCVSIVILAYVSIKVRRKGVDFFISDKGHEPLKLLSDKQRRDYQLHVWAGIGIATLFVITVSLALILHFNGVVRLATSFWISICVGLVFTLWLFYGLVQRTRGLVRKMTTQLAEEHAHTPVADS